jgi:hypothetical protein
MSENNGVRSRVIKWSNRSIALRDVSSSPTPAAEPQMQKIRWPKEPQTPEERLLFENAHRFAAALLTPQSYTQTETGLYRHKVGFLTDNLQSHEGFLTSSFVQVAKDRYGLDLALFGRNKHAHTVLKYPEDDGNGNWNVTVYDPMRGVRVIDLPGFMDPLLALQQNADTRQYSNIRSFTDVMNVAVSDETKRLNKSGIHTSSRGIDRTYSLIGSGQVPDLPVLQRIDGDCVPLSFFMGAHLASQQPGPTEWKSRGIQQFVKDFGITP